MYRKEECLSLLKDPEQNEVDDDNKDDFEKTPALKWHKVNLFFMDGWDSQLDIGKNLLIKGKKEI